MPPRKPPSTHIVGSSVAAAQGAERAADRAEAQCEGADLETELSAEKRPFKLNSHGVDIATPDIIKKSCPSRFSGLRDKNGFSRALPDSAQPWLAGPNTPNAPFPAGRDMVDNAS